MQGNPTKSTFGWDLLPDKNCVEGGHPSCRAVFPGHSQLSVWDSTQKDNDRYQSRTVNPTLDAGHPPKVSCLPQQTTCKEEGKRRRLARNLSLDRYLDLLHTLSRSSNSTSDYCQIRQLNEQESSAIRLDDLKAVLSVAGCSVIARTKLDYLRQMCGMYLASPTCIGIEIDLDLPDRGSPSSPLLGGIKRGLEWLASGRLGSDVIPVVAQNGYYSYCELEQNRCNHENQYEGSCSFSPEVKAVDGADFCQTRSETRLSQPVIPRIELVDNAIDCPLQQDSPRYEHIKWLISEMIDISKQYNINDKDRLDVFVGCKVLIVIIEDLINEGACLLNQGLYIAEVVRPVSMYHDQDFCMEDCTKKHRFSIVRIIGHNSTGPTNLESNEEIDASVELQTDLADDCRIKTYKGFLTLPEFQLAEAWALLQSKAE